MGRAPAGPRAAGCTATGRTADDSDMRLREAVKETQSASTTLQAILNRVSYLQMEEAKLEREIRNARKRAEELLASKVQRAQAGQDVQAVAEVLDALQASDNSKKRATKKGRSSLTAVKTVVQAKGPSGTAIIAGEHGLPPAPADSSTVASLPPPPGAPPSALSSEQLDTDVAAEPLVPSPRDQMQATASRSKEVVLKALPSPASSGKAAMPAGLPGDLSPMAVRKACRQQVQQSKLGQRDTTHCIDGGGEHSEGEELPHSCAHQTSAAPISATDQPDPNNKDEMKMAVNRMMQGQQAGMGLTKAAAGRDSCCFPQPIAPTQPTSSPSGMAVLTQGNKSSNDGLLATLGIPRTARPPHLPRTNRLDCLAAGGGGTTNATVVQTQQVPCSSRNVQGDISPSRTQTTEQKTAVIHKTLTSTRVAPAAAAGACLSASNGASAAALAAGVGWGIETRGVGHMACAVSDGSCRTDQPRSQGDDGATTARSSSSLRSCCGSSSSVSCSTSHSSGRASSARSVGGAGSRTSRPASSRGSSRSSSRPGATAAATPGAGDRPSIESEMLLKRQIWQLRRTFGLQPAVLKDSGACVVDVVGAGAWQT